MKHKKEYLGTCYLGVVGPEAEIGECRDSMEEIRLRPGDGRPVFVRATKGYEARQLHIDRFMQSKHDFILLLDHDMIYPPDTLERLRIHRLPFVSGFYMRRRFSPIAPVWFKASAGRWPMEPFTERPESGKLYPLGASGWGCMLMHRDVITDTRAILKGELDVAEDDMDVWPYDLTAIMSAVRGLRQLADARPKSETLWAALDVHTATLEKEIRPLRGVKDPVGSDIRFPFFARAAGYQLMGDPDVRASHVLNYPLAANDYISQPDDYIAGLAAEIGKGVKAERNKISATLRRLGGEK